MGYLIPHCFETPLFDLWIHTAYTEQSLHINLCCLGREKGTAKYALQGYALLRHNMFFFLN